MRRLGRESVHLHLTNVERVGRKQTPFCTSSSYWNRMRKGSRCCVTFLRLAVVGKVCFLTSEITGAPPCILYSIFSAEDESVLRLLLEAKMLPHRLVVYFLAVVLHERERTSTNRNALYELREPAPKADCSFSRAFSFVWRSFYHRSGACEYGHKRAMEMGLTMSCQES